MPADMAAASRLMPQRALAIASMRRATRASGSDLASLRKTAGVPSRRIDRSDILPSIEPMTTGNPDPTPTGIGPRQHESNLRTDGITYTDLDDDRCIAGLIA